MLLETRTISVTSEAIRTGILLTKNLKTEGPHLRASEEGTGTRYQLLNLQASPIALVATSAQ